MDPKLQHYLDSPLDAYAHSRINKVFLPEGRKPTPRAGKIKTEPAPGDLTPKQVREKREKEESDKLVAVLDYYATTTVPFERVAEHTKLTLEQATQAMTRRGRSQ